MIEINGRKFMNIQEAVQWLLENNALPFMCKADYAADTIIAKSEIVNPSPAELKVGAVVYFHDCKIAVVTGITSNGFKVGSDHIDMREGLFDGDIQIDGDLTVDGDASVFEKIVDKDGHRRFQEWDGTPLEQAGVTFSFCKASLSGSHLMIVIAFSVTDMSYIANNEYLASFALPQWIYDKIQILWGSFVTSRDDAGMDDNWASQNITTVLRKDYDLIRIQTIGAITLTSDKNFRIQYDLIIDNE